MSGSRVNIKKYLQDFAENNTFLSGHNLCIPFKVIFNDGKDEFDLFTARKKYGDKIRKNFVKYFMDKYNNDAKEIKLIKIESTKVEKHTYEQN